MIRLRAPLLGLLVLIACLLVAAGCGDSDSSGSSKSGGSSKASSGGGGCDEGPGERNGVDIVQHCGDASADLKIGDASGDFGDGNCQNTDDSVVVNVGATVLDPDAGVDAQAKEDYLGLLAGKHPGASDDAPAADKDGDYSKGVLVTGAVDGKVFTLTEADLTLSDDRSTGEFSGTSLQGDEVEGSFDCG